jgi:hypothetical protein
MLKWLGEWFNGDYIREIEAELARMTDERNRALCGELTLNTLVAGNGGFSAELGTKMAGVLATCFEKVLDELGGENYVELVFENAEGEKIVITVLKPKGKTPHQLKIEAEAERDLALAEESEQLWRVAGLQGALDAAGAEIERLSAIVAGARVCHAINARAAYGTAPYVEEMNVEEAWEAIGRTEKARAK